MTLDARYDRLLNDIEDIERVSLQWGDVDGSLSYADGCRLAQREFGENAEDAIEDLIDAKLIIRCTEFSGEERYRSRFAELIRLVARSRQIFRDEDWRGAPPLVADFRIDMRARRYPDRDIPRGAFLSNRAGTSESQKIVWTSLAPELLAEFQVRATNYLLDKKGSDSGAIITAGTGSGKTLAFYLPALLQISEQLDQKDYSTKVLALYPRSELLKDQFTEAASNIARIRKALTEAGRRGIRVGTLYSDTPRSVKDFEQSWFRSWPKSAAGRRCPFLRCPEPGCGGDMIWSDENISKSIEILTCQTCKASTNPDEIPLTRDSIKKRPPDILFTTTEMLNRTLSDRDMRHLIGIPGKTAGRVSMLLLDEAHTYEGAAGAQAALVLRRWRFMVEGPIKWVGLSATLEAPDQFFSDLTGVARSDIAHIAPRQTDMIEEGREYQIALRGDPAARTSLLSTSIQALMLLSRSLDPRELAAGGRYASKVFAFTDDLDVTHRLFDSLCDAEGYDLFGKPSRSTLAAMRAQDVATYRETADDRTRRDRAGQRWIMPETVGNPLDRRLLVAKTTSRDPGVNSQADVIVATSALEVGFNDPSVGAVLQHKSPMSFASFIQRKGRAGRLRTTRPITMTVLSDYGRDKAAFQSAEFLFDPILSASRLPVGNHYILKMQAVFVLFDWLASQNLPMGINTVTMWRTASQPRHDESKYEEKWRAHIKRLLTQLNRGDHASLNSLRAHIRGALKVDELVVDQILWGPPRSLLLEVVPTLLRRLSRNWELAFPTAQEEVEFHTRGHPLPEFVPRALFSDLNLPEIDLLVPGTGSQATPSQEALKVELALSRFAPGRVDRRYGDTYGGQAHWVPVPAGVEDFHIPISTYARHSEFLGEFDGYDGEKAVSLPVYRPWMIELQNAPANTVKPTSNSTLKWVSGFVPQGSPLQIDTPNLTVWRHMVRSVELYLHTFEAGVSVRRFSSQARADIRRANSLGQIVDITFTDDSENEAAVGFEFETDGMAVHLNVPSIGELVGRKLDPTIELGVRSALYRSLVDNSSSLPRDCNSFQRTWIRRVHFLASLRMALDEDKSLTDASKSLRLAGFSHAYEEIMDAMLGEPMHQSGCASSGEHQDENEDDESDQNTGTMGANRLDALRGDVAAHLHRQEIVTELDALLSETMDPETHARATFLRRTVEATLAQAVMSAAIAAAPRRAVSDSLIVDAIPSPTDKNEVVLWLTETTAGGAGLLAALAEHFSGEPRALFRGLEAALEPTDLETAASTLEEAFALASNDALVASAVSDVRAEKGHEGRQYARTKLLDLFEGRGLQINRAATVSLNARMLGYFFTAQHDKLVNYLNAYWRECENRIGFELDLADFAVIATFSDDVDQLASEAGLYVPAEARSRKMKYLTSLLWPRMNVLRRDVSGGANRFHRQPVTDPALVRALLFEPSTTAIPVSSPNCVEEALAQLASDGVVLIEGHIGDLAAIKSTLLLLPTHGVIVGELRLFPTLERFARTDQTIRATFILRESV